MTDDTQPPPDPDAARMGRLLARPQPAPEIAATGVSPVAPGSHALDLAGADGRECLLYVPADYDATRPAPLVLWLHGAGRAARGALAPLAPLADAAGLILLAPDARMHTWDVIMGGYGPDVTSSTRH